MEEVIAADEWLQWAWKSQPYMRYTQGGINVTLEGELESNNL